MAGPRLNLLFLSHMVAFGLGAGAIAIIHAAGEKGPVAAEVSDRPPASVPQVEPPPLVQLAPPPLNRAEMMAAAAKAADATAGGDPLPQSNRDLVGRSFVIRLPFGCAGPQKEGASSWAGWTYDEKTRALRLTARPAMLEVDDWIAKDSATTTPYDAIDGFWISRPWTSSERCINETGKGRAEVARTSARPENQASGDQIAFDRQLAIGTFYAPGASRTRQRGGRPYTSTIKLEENETPSTKGYSLVLSGRLAAFDDGQPVHCRQESPDRPPRCILSVSFDTVAFEQPGKDKPLVEWR